MCCKLSIWFVILISLACVPQVGAETLTFSTSTEYSNGTPPTGPTPWMTATFADVRPGTVELTLENTNLVGTEFVSEWCFNLDPSMDPTSLQFGTPSKTGSFTDPTIDKGVNSFKADGDGKYDFRFNFATDDGVPTRFGVDESGVGDSMSIEISGLDLTANSFYFLSEPAGGHGPFYTAVHVQGISTDKSGWVTGTGSIVVPEPGSLVMLVMAGLGLLCYAWRRRRS